MDGLNIGSRAALDAGVLSLYMARREGPFSLLLLALRALMGRLRQAKDFEEFTAAEVRIETWRPRERLAALPASLRARPAMAVFAAAGADLFLSGHLHVGHTAHPVDRYPLNDRSALVIHAGTATSNRQRGERNSFNVLRLEGGRLGVVRFEFDPDGGAFIPRPEERYERGSRGWLAA